METGPKQDFSMVERAEIKEAPVAEITFSTEQRRRLEVDPLDGIMMAVITTPVQDGEYTHFFSFKVNINADGWLEFIPYPVDPLRSHGGLAYDPRMLETGRVSIPERFSFKVECSGVTMKDGSTKGESFIGCRDMMFGRMGKILHLEEDFASKESLKLAISFGSVSEVREQIMPHEYTMVQTRTIEDAKQIYQKVSSMPLVQEPMG